MFGHGYFRDFRQDINIGEAKSKAKAAEQKAEDIQMLLQRKIDKLSLIVQALWSYIRDQHNITEEALMEKVREIDLQDGMLDGKVSEGRVK